MLAAFISLPARPPSLSCIFILEATSFYHEDSVDYKETHTSDFLCEIQLSALMNATVLEKENTDFFFN